MDLKLDKLEAENQGDITAPTLILCEGKKDAAFFRKLIDTNELRGFQIGYPSDLGDKTGGKWGKDGFGDYLDDLTTRLGYSKLEHIVIVRDCDEVASDSFGEVQKQIAEMETKKLPVPSTIEQKTNGRPSVTVLMLPSATGVGNLESLLLGGLKPNLQHQDCIDKFFTCCRFDELSPGVSAKKKLTTIVAAYVGKNPSCSLTSIWSSAWEKENPLSIAHESFQRLVDFLRQYADPKPE